MFPLVPICFFETKAQGLPGIMMGFLLCNLPEHSTSTVQSETHTIAVKTTRQTQPTSLGIGSSYFLHPPHPLSSIRHPELHVLSLSPPTFLFRCSVYPLFLSDTPFSCSTVRHCTWPLSLNSVRVRVCLCVCVYHCVRVSVCDFKGSVQVLTVPDRERSKQGRCTYLRHEH